MVSISMVKGEPPAWWSTKFSSMFGSFNSEIVRCCESDGSKSPQKMLAASITKMFCDIAGSYEKADWG